jgi:hypothetical protein
MLYVETILMVYIFFQFVSYFHFLPSCTRIVLPRVLANILQRVFVLKFQETWQETKFYEHKVMILIEDIPLCFNYHNKTYSLLRQNVISYMFYCDKAVSIQGLYFQLFWYSMLYFCVID